MNVVKLRLVLGMGAAAGLPAAAWAEAPPSSVDLASVHAEASDDPVVPLAERPDGGVVVTHVVDVAGRVVRLSGLSEEARSRIKWLADNERALKDGRVRVIKKAEAEAVIAEVARATKEEVKNLPGVTLAAGGAARMTVGMSVEEATAVVMKRGSASVFASEPAVGVSMTVSPQMTRSGRVALTAAGTVLRFDGFVDESGRVVFHDVPGVKRPVLLVAEAKVSGRLGADDALVAWAQMERRSVVEQVGVPVLVPDAGAAESVLMVFTAKARPWKPRTGVP